MTYRVRKISELDVCAEDVIRVANTQFFYTGDFLCISLPGWGGWKPIDFTQEHTFDHVAHWEIYFASAAEQFIVLLRVTWQSLAELLLGFLCPDDSYLVSLIVRHGCIVLLDRKLCDGKPAPFSNGLILEQIPCDPPFLLDLGLPSPDIVLQ